MKALKTAGIILLVIVVFLIIISFFLPSRVKVERSMVIKASHEIVFNQVSYLKNWEKWSPWHKRDTAMKIIYEGPECGKGASYTWESLKSEVGNGKMIITVSAPYDSLCIDMFLMENKDTAKNIFRFEKDKEGTKATWIFSSNIGLNPI